MSLLIIMLTVLLLVLAAALVLTAYSILRPPRMSDGKALYILGRLTPADLGMQFEPITFTVRDERTGNSLDLAAWWIPNPAGGDKTVVLIHGYADAKVGAIAWAPTWRDLGYHILAIDLRAHGESGGKYATAGVFERHDLDQVLNQLRAARAQQTQHLVLFGVSLGTITALATAALRDDIAALVLECPISNFRDSVYAHMELFRLPLSSMLPIVMRVARWISGADIDRIKPLELIQTVKCPVMVIQSGEDVFVSGDDATAIEAAVKQRHDDSVYWLVPDAPHVLALHVDPAEYVRRIGDFLGTLKAELASRPTF